MTAYPATKTQTAKTQTSAVLGANNPPILNKSTFQLVLYSPQIQSEAWGDGDTSAFRFRSVVR